MSGNCISSCAISLMDPTSDTKYVPGFFSQLILSIDEAVKYNETVQKGSTITGHHIELSEVNMRYEHHNYHIVVTM